MDNPFKNFLKHGERSVIGIDIGASAIKVVQLAKVRGKAVLKTYGSLALGPYAGLSIGQATALPADKISEIINDLLKEANVTTRNAGVAIPLRSSLVSLIEVPTLSDREMQQMIPLEARKYIPVPVSEVTMDWWVIPKEEEKSFDFEGFNKTQKTEGPAKISKTEVLVVSIHNEILNTFASIIKSATLDTSFFEIEMFASIRSLIDRETAPVAIFDMGAAGTKLYIVDRGVIRKSHIINKGSQDLTLAISQGLQVTPEKAEKIKRNLHDVGADEKAIFDIISLPLDYIFSEASTVLLAYQKKYNKSIGKVILTGGGVALFGLTERAKTRFETEVVLGNPFSKVETPAFLTDILKTTGLDFSVAVGIALRKLQEIG